MKHSTLTPPTLKDAIAHMEVHGTDSQKQDTRKARTVFALHDIEAADFESFQAELATFDRKVPKLTGTMPGLQRLIHAAGISDNTYKQSWRAARRLIEVLSNAATEKKERHTRDDAWATLHSRVTVLVKVGLVDSFVLRGLPALTDACRLLCLGPTDLNTETVATLLNTDGTHQRKTLRKGLKALDILRNVPRLADLMPAAEATPAPKRAGRLATLPQHLQTSINTWVKHAAREQIEDARYAHLAKPLSESAQYRYSAALSLWVETLVKSGVDLPPGTELASLFVPDQVDSVLGFWSSAKVPAARTQYHYVVDLAAILSRHGLSNEASYVAGMTGNSGVIVGDVDVGVVGGRIDAQLCSAARLGKVDQNLFHRFVGQIAIDRNPKGLFGLPHIEGQQAMDAAIVNAFNSRRRLWPGVHPNCGCGGRGFAQKNPYLDVLLTRVALGDIVVERGECDQGQRSGIVIGDVDVGVVGGRIDAQLPPAARLGKVDRNLFQRFVDQITIDRNPNGLLSLPNVEGQQAMDAAIVNAFHSGQRLWHGVQLHLGCTDRGFA